MEITFILTDIHSDIYKTIINQNRPIGKQAHALAFYPQATHWGQWLGQLQHTGASYIWALYIAMSNSVLRAKQKQNWFWSLKCGVYLFLVNFLLKLNYIIKKVRFCDMSDLQTLVLVPKFLQLSSNMKFYFCVAPKSEIKLTCLMKPVTVKRWVNRADK